MTVTKSSAGNYDVGDDGFNFYSDTTGSAPTGWTCSNQVIIDNYKNHSKVLTRRVLAASTGYTSFSAVDNGVIEFYVAVSNASGSIGYLYVRDATDSEIIGLWFNEDDVWVRHNGGNTKIAEGFGTDWYHVSLEWNNSGAPIDFRGDGNLADGKARVYVNGTQYGDYTVKDTDDATDIWFSITGFQVYLDGIGFSWDATYNIGDNLALDEDITITASLISQMKLHYPTTLEPTNVKFDGKTYEKYYPVCVAKINPSEIIPLGTTIKITDNLTSGGATASSVIFKGEVVKKLTSKASGFIPSYLIFSNAKEMDSIKPEGSYTKDTDGYISDILTNLCDKLTEGTLSDGADLGTFTAAGDKSLTLIIKQCARFDGYVAYIDSSAGADNADLMYNDGSTDTGVDIDESSSTLRGLRAFSQLDEHINKVIVRGGIQSDGTRAEGTASDTTSQGLYGIVPTYDTDTNLNTDALCASKAAQILADNEFGNRRVVLGYKDATKGMLQPGETVTFDWDADVHDIGLSIEQEQYIIARNIYDPLVGLNVLTLFSSIYYPPISDGELLQETSHVALQNSDNIVTNNTLMEAYLAIGSANARWKSLSLHSADVATSMTTRTYFSNTGANDFYMLYNIDLPPKLGTLDLYISELQILIHTSDATDYVTRIRFFVYTDEDSGSTPVDLDHDTLSGTAKGIYTYDSGDDGDLPYNCGSGVFMGVLVDVVATTQDEVKLTGFRVKYYYA